MTGAPPTMRVSETVGDEEDPFEEWLRQMMRLFRKMQEDLERQFRELMEEGVDLDEIEEKFPRLRTPSGMEIRGPMVYGYYMTIGPDGKPRIRYFGNVGGGEPKEEIEEVEEEVEAAEVGHGSGEGVETKLVREPVVDVMDFGDEIVVVAEIPGVKKEDIKLRLKGGRLSVRAGHYRADVDLPAKVDAKGTKASYNNGILEVRLRKIS